MTVFFCPEFNIPPIWRARFPYLFPQGTGNFSLAEKQINMYLKHI
jgi:hypothetical protein